MELIINSLTKTYGKKVALNSFTYTFKTGICGILGANGAGKSTLMNLITDNVKRETGDVLYNGKDVLKLGGAFRSVLGYMPQQQGMYDQFSAYAFLFYIAELKGISHRDAKRQINELLEIVSLKDSAHRPLGTFSGGMRQRVLLAQALLGSPEVIILDEPTAGLDPKERINLRSYVANLAKDKIVLWTTHIVSDIESIADDCILMKSGELIASGSPLALVQRTNCTNLESVYMAYLGDDSEVGQ